jgi:hypothetical protein
MSVRCVPIVLIVITGSTAYAFDPFTIATGAQAVSGILGSIREVDELADAGFAVADLVDELDIDTETDQEIEIQVRRLEEIERQSRSLRDGERDIKSLIGQDLARSRSFASRVRRVRDMIQTTKRLAALMGLRPKAGEKGLKVQEARLQYMILDELMAIRRMQFESALENKEQRAKYQLALGQVLEEEGKTNRRDLSRGRMR